MAAAGSADAKKGQALGNRRSPALQKLAVEMYARGLSTRDIEDLLGELCDDERGDQTLLSRSAVSRVTEALWEEYEALPSAIANPHFPRSP